MTGDTVISVPIGKKQGERVKDVAPLKNAAFFRFSKTGGIEACRRSISAILLIAVSTHGSNVVGLLHPAPAVEFNEQLLARIPLVRLKSWPVEPGGLMEVEWLRPAWEPKPTGFFHRPPELSDSELRGD